MATVKHLSYAGVALLLPTPELEAGWLAQIQNPYDFEDLRPWHFDAPRAEGVPYPPVPTPPTFRLNSLYWPTGASRPAWFHTVLNFPRLAEVKAALGPTNVAAPLVLYDGRTGKTVTAWMRMLPERPLNVSCGADAEKHYLVTLTDERLAWYGRRGRVSAPSSWADLYSQLAAILGVSIAAEAVDPDYGTPTEKWALDYPSTPALLDAVAASVGQKVVVALDGSVRTVGWATAASDSDAYFATADPPTAGGRAPAAGIARTVPYLARSVFAASGAYASGGPYAADAPLFPLSIPEYGTASGIPGDRQTLYPDALYTGDAAALDALAEVAARDFYGWQLADADVAWPGVEPFEPTGWEDFCEWTLTTRGPDAPFALTRVRRGAWKEFDAGGLVPTDPSGGGGSGSGLRVEGADGSPSYFPVTVLQFQEADGFTLSQPAAQTARVGLQATGLSNLLFGINNTSVVTQNGLTVYNLAGVYAVGLGIGCGLKFASGAAAVDNVALAGDRAVTSMINGPGCTLAFDYTPFDERCVDYVTDWSAAPDFCGGELVFTRKKRTICDEYNRAGVLVNRTYGDEVTDTFTVDVCGMVYCCYADPLAVTATADPQYGPHPLVVSFDATVTGGVGPFTFLWDFDDGTTSGAEDPVHTFDDPGVYEVVVTVTDAGCDCTAEYTLFVYVGDPCACGGCFDQPQRYTFTLEGGSNDFAGANGEWTVHNVGGCTWLGHRGGFSCAVNVTDFPPGCVVFLQKLDGSGVYARWEGDPVFGCCDGWPAGNLTLDDFFGPGSVPPTFTIAAPDGIEDLDCEVCGDAAGCCGGDLLDPAYDVLYVRLYNASGCADVDGLVVRLDRSGTTADTWEFTSSTGGTGGCGTVTSASFNCTSHALTITWGADNIFTSNAPEGWWCPPADFRAAFRATLTFGSEETCCSGTVVALVSTTPP